MTTTTTTAPTVPVLEQPARRLRAVLAANASTSMLAGLSGVVAAPFWADTLGVSPTGWIRAVSIGLVLFAAGVALVAWRSTELRTGAVAVSVADLAWVAATGLAVAAVDFSTAGTVLAVVQGVAVLDFALAQLWLRSRLA